MRSGLCPPWRAQPATAAGRRLVHPSTFALCARIPFRRPSGKTGAKPKAGVCGFSVSNLCIPQLPLAWEDDCGKPERIASALEIMLQGPIGAAAFNNEFGRPNICGYFRIFEQRCREAGRDVVRGYHKPIMIAGGLGNVRRAHVEKKRRRRRRAAGRTGRSVDADRLGRRGRLLGRQRPEFLGSGLRVGAARQPGNAAPRAGGHRPLLGARRGQPHPADPRCRCGRAVERAAGGHRAQPAAAAASNCARSRAPSRELSPMEIWCNEAQERYVLALRPERAGVCGVVRARALPVRGGRRDHRRRAMLRVAIRCSATRRSTCRSRCCSARRRA